MSSSVANNEHLQLTRQLIIHTFPAQKLRLTLAQNCLKRIMSQLLDNTKKLTKKREKKSKIIFGSEYSKANNEPTFRIHQKN